MTAAIAGSRQGFQIKPVTGGQLQPVGSHTAVWLDFINENKNDILYKNENSTQCHDH